MESNLGGQFPPGGVGQFNRKLQVIAKNSNNWNFYYNTICTGAYTFINSGATNNEFKNNIFSVEDFSLATKYFAFSSDVKVKPGNLDHNIYWNPKGTYLVKNQFLYTADNFNTSLAGGLNSKNFQPDFYSVADLRIRFNSLGTGSYLAGVPKDCFGNERSTVIPTIGAHEPDPINTDVFIQSIVNPGGKIKQGQQTVILRLQNNGKDSITSIKASYQVNSGAIVTESFSFQAIGTAQTRDLVFSKPNTHTTGCFSFRAWVSRPNGITDLDSSNDSTSILNFGIPLSGTYTVGGVSSDYKTINDAVNSLICGGVNGPVFFNIQPGIYREKVSVPNIEGASNFNWITFQSATGNANDVIIIDSATVFNKDYHVWRFDHSKYMTLRKVSIIVKGETFGWGIHVYGACKKIKIKACNIWMSDSIRARIGIINNGAYIPLVISDSKTYHVFGAQVDSIEIDSNYFKYGYINLSIVGLGDEVNEGEIYVRNNLFYGGGRYHVNVTYISGFKFQNNQIIGAKNALEVSYGLFLQGVSQRFSTSSVTEVSGNIFQDGIGASIHGCLNKRNVRGLFANNLSTGRIYFSGCTNWSVCYNTINICEGAAPYAFYNQGGNLDINNNIFSVTSPLANSSSLASYSDFANMSHNVYYNPKGAYLFNFKGYGYSVSDYKNSPSWINSYNIQPLFYNPKNDLRIKDACFGSALFMNTVQKDYYGTSRSQSASTIGAYEVKRLSVNAGATRIISPSSSINTSSSYNLEVEIQNTGRDTIKSLVISYKLNTGNPVTDSFTSLKIPPCGLGILKFTGSKTVTFSAGYNQIIVYINKVNGSKDSLGVDDTTSVHGFCARLSGNFTINPKGSGSKNFKNFNEAINALYSCGVNGPVVIIAAAGTYNEQLSFTGRIPGASRSNTITFDGVSAKQCKIEFGPVSSPFVVQFVGATQIRFLNFTIINRGIDNKVGFLLQSNKTQGCDSLLIKGCIVSEPLQGATFSVGFIISNSNFGEVKGNTANATIIDSNIINGGNYGILWYGNGCRNNSITRNILNNQLIKGIEVAYQSEMEISKNIINDLAGERGIMANDLRESKINKNKICNQAGGYGLWLSNCSGSSNAVFQVSNNMISVGISKKNPSVGIALDGITYCDLVYNSVNVYSVQGQGAAIYGNLYVNTFNNNRIVNNNFASSADGLVVHFTGKVTDWQASFRQMNTNNYFTKGKNTFAMDGSYVSSISTWATSLYMGSANDTKSKMIDPEYFDECDLHSNSVGLDSMGTIMSNYKEDYDGELRHTKKPDIGADEYLPSKNNIGPLLILKPSPPAAAGMTDVWVTIKNFGPNKIDSAIVNYKLGKNGSVKSVKWKKALTYQAIDTAKFTGSNQYLLRMGSRDTLYAFTESPNGVADGFKKNDTIWFCACATLGGTFTLGANVSDTNFVNWNDASKMLTKCGIHKPLVVNVEPGAYSEQVVFEAVPGAGGNRTITFQAANGNPNSVTLKHLKAEYYFDNYVLNLRGAKRFIFKNLSMASWDANSTLNGYRVIVLESKGTLNSDSNLFYNNIITGQPDFDTTNNNACIYSSGLYNQYNRFVRNTINNGAFGVYYYGYKANPFTQTYNKGVIIDSNIISNFNFGGIYTTSLDSVSSSYNLIQSNSDRPDKFGIKHSSVAGKGSIIHNDIRLSNDANNGIHIQVVSYPNYLSIINAKLNLTNNNISLLNTSSKQKYGISFTSNLSKTYMTVFHNNINVSGWGGGAHFLSSIYDSSIKISNNNFITEAGISLSLNGVGSVYKQVNHNNYYNKTEGSVLTQILKEAYTSLNSMKAGLYKYPFSNDSNSLSINPNYFTPSNLHVMNVALAGAGTKSDVKTDFDNHTRNSFAPTIGSYEMGGNLKVSQILEKDLCQSLSPKTIKVRVKNSGRINSTYFYVNYKINNGPVHTDTFYTTLNSGDSILINHSVKTVFSKAGIYTIKAFTSYDYDVDVNDTQSLSIKVFASPEPSFTYKDTCAGGTVILKSTATVSDTTIKNNFWSFGDGNTATGDSTSKAYSKSDTFYNVKLISTSNFGCTDSITRAIKILSPLKPGKVKSNQKICYNTMPSVLTSDSASGSDKLYKYQWQSSADKINFVDINGATSLSYQPDSLISKVYYRMSLTTNSGCGPAYSDTITIDVNSALNAGNIGSAQTICYNGIGSALNFITKPTGAFGTYKYQWQQSHDSINWSDLSGQTNPDFIPNSLTGVTYFRVVVSSGTCLPIATNAVKIDLYAPITGGSIENGQTICGGNFPATFTESSAAGGGPGTYDFQWQYSVDSINWYTIAGSDFKDYSSGKLFQTTLFRRLAESKGCPSGISNVIKVLVLPKPNVNFIVSTHCLNDTMPLINNSSIMLGSLSYAWDFGDGTSSLFSNPSKIYTVQGIYNVKLIAISDSACIDSLAQPVMVVTKPLARFTHIFKCEGDSVLFNDETFYSCVSTSGLTFNWDFGDSSLSSVQNPRHHYSKPGIYNVKFKISLPGGYADSISMLIDFNIRSTPNFSASGICFPSPVTFTNNSSGYSFLNWTYGDGSSDTITTTSFNKTYGAAGNYNVKLVSTSFYGCRDSFMKTISVFSKPIANYSVSNTCLGLTTSFKNLTNGAVIYKWNFGNGDTSTNDNPNYIYPDAGTFKVKLNVISSDGCGDFILDSVIIYKNPSASFTTSNVCKGFATKFTNTSTGANSYSWNFGNGDSSRLSNPAYIYGNSGNYKVILNATNIHGCSKSFTDSHTVFELPVAAFTGDNVCIGQTTTFNNMSWASISNKWSFGDGSNSISSNPVKIYSAPGTYNVKLSVINSFGCKDSVSKSVTVYVLPLAKFSASNACFGAAVNFNNQSTQADSYKWDFGNSFSNTVASPNYNYPSAGTYTVKLTLESGKGCKDSISKSITVYPAPVAGFSIANNARCLSGNVFNPANSSVITSGKGTYLWDFGDTKTDTAKNPKKTYTSAGTYNIRLIAINNNACRDTIIKTVTVHPQPVIDFTINNNGQCLNINSFNFTNNSTLTSGKFTGKWDLGDNTSDTSKNIYAKTYSSAKTYTVKLVLSSNFSCLDSLSKTVSVNTVPIAGYTVPNTAQCLSGNSFKFTNTSTISSGTLTYRWTFGSNPSTLTNPSWSFSNHGTFNAKLVAKSNNGCTDSITKSITVHPKTSPAFTVYDNDQCFEYNSFAFTNTSTIPSGSFSSKWDFGDNTYDTSTHVKAKRYSLNIEKFYPVKLVLTSGFGCKDSLTKSAAYVRVNPVAGFIISNPAQCLKGNNFVLTNYTNDASKFTWDFGDSKTASSMHAAKSYTNFGTYNITMYAENMGNGCKDTITKTVTVHPQPKAGFTIDDYSQCLKNNSFSFTNQSSLEKPDTVSKYIWNFREGPEVFSKSPIYNYKKPGLYNVVLMVLSSKGCFDTLNQSLAVYSQAKINFSINDSTQCKSNNIFIFNNTTTLDNVDKSDIISSYNWNFNEGLGSTSKSPQYSYMKPGFYDVSLITETNRGCIDTLTRSLIVHPQSDINFKIVDSAQCNNNDTFNFINNTSINKIEKSDTVSSYAWNFKEGSISNLKAPQYSYTKAGFYNVTLVTKTDKGCVDSLIQSLVVYPQANIDFKINDPSQCNSIDTFRFINSTTLGKIEKSDTINSYTWNFREGPGSNLISPEYSYQKPGFYNITLATHTDKGCVDSLIRSIIVHPQANIDFGIKDTAQCNSVDTFHFINTTTFDKIEPNDSIGLYQWNFREGSGSILKSPQYSYINPGSYNITLITNTDKGCIDSMVRSLVVHPQANIGFKIDDTAQCVSGNLFLLEDTSTIVTGSVTRTWNFGDGGTGAISPVSHTYSNDGTYSVKLSLLSDKGCKDSLIQHVIVYPKPIVSFDMNDSVQCFQLNDFQFINNSTIGSGTLSYHWQFGDWDSSVLLNPSHQYAILGNLSVKLIATSVFACKDSLSHSITVNPHPPIPQIMQTGVYLETDADSGIQWYLDFNSIPDGIDKVLPAKVSGIYTLIVHNEFGCPEKSDSFNYIYNGSGGLGIVVFPNPSPGVFRITSLTALDKIEIIDLNGQIVFSKNYENGTYTEFFNLYISRSDYFIRAHTGDENETIKIKVVK